MFWAKDWKDLSTSFVVDEASSMKYEVVKDANGKYLVSELPTTQYVTKGNKISLYIQVTAPPKGTKVTINIPQIQPFLGVEMQ